MSINFAVVGFGHIGKRHATMIQQNPDCRLVAVSDIDTSLATVAEKDFGVPFHDSLTTLLESNHEIDVVCIATPNGLHAAQAIECLDHKCHVVCEKPMGLSKSNCEDVIFKALQASRQVFCVMQNRYSPPSVWLKSMIHDKRLGNIYMVQINCFWNRDRRYYENSDWKGTMDLDGGPLFTQFSHFIDIMYWLFGDIKDVEARFEKFKSGKLTEFEDSGFVNFNFVNGGMGTFNYSTAIHDKNLESSITIIGEQGTIKVGGQYMDKVEYCHVRDYEMEELPESAPPNDYGAYKGSAANHHFIFQNVVDTLQGESTITTNALEGLKVVEIIERIYNTRNL